MLLKFNKKWLEDKISFYLFLSIIFFICSLLFYGTSIYFKQAKEKKVEIAQKKVKIFYEKLGLEIQEKAGSIITNNSIDPLVYKTILRIADTLPYSEIHAYNCEKNIIEINTGNEGDIDYIKREVKYAEIIQKTKTSYLVQIFD